MTTPASPMGQPLLSTTAYLEALARDSGEIAAAAYEAGPGAPVPSCPGWTVADLVVHLGNVQRWAAAMVSTLALDRIDRSAMNEEPSADALLPWFEAASARLVETLAAADPSAPIWTFTPDHTVRFWFRRQAQEAAVHRWDAEHALGRRAPIDAELAADGVAEWLDLTTVRAAAKLVGRGETVHLHCTDTGRMGTESTGSASTGHTGTNAGEWLVSLTPDGPTVDPIHAKGDVAARGTASDLDLFLWGRVDADALEVFGDAGLLERFRDAGFA